MDSNPSQSTMQQIIPFVVSGIAILFWGSAFTAIAIGLEGFGAGELAVFRFSVASLFAGMIWFGRIRIPQSRDIPRFIGVGLFGFTSYHLLLNFGQRVVPPGTASLLVQTVPVWTALLASWFGKERIRKREWVGVAIAFWGAMVIIIGQGKDISFSSSSLLILAAAFSTAVYFVFGRPLTIQYGVITFTAWSLWIGTLPMLYFFPSAWAQCRQAEGAPILAAIFLGIFPTVIAYGIWMNVMKRLGASRTAFLLYASPVVTIFTAWIWYGSIPTPLTLLGGMIAVVGVVIINTRRNGAHKKI